MPHPDEPYYCSEQIAVPPELPDILKQFTKAAIRTQPKDLLTWSAKWVHFFFLCKNGNQIYRICISNRRYFRCLANNEVPPVKERLEMDVATQKTDSGLTIGLVKTLHKQLSIIKPLTLKQIEEKWKALHLPKENFDLIVQLGVFRDQINWLMFMAIACSTISRVSWRFFIINKNTQMNEFYFSCFD